MMHHHLPMVNYHTLEDSVEFPLEFEDVQMFLFVIFTYNLDRHVAVDKQRDLHRHCFENTDKNVDRPNEDLIVHDRILNR